MIVMDDCDCVVEVAAILQIRSKNPVANVRPAAGRLIHLNHMLERIIQGKGQSEDLPKTGGFGQICCRKLSVRPGKQLQTRC